jgi:hypothetical protein
MSVAVKVAVHPRLQKSDIDTNERSNALLSNTCTGIGGIIVLVTRSPDAIDVIVSPLGSPT